MARKRRLRHVFQILEQTGAADWSGHDADQAWTVLAVNGTVYGEIWSVSGTERTESQKTETEITHRIRAHYHPTMTTANRLQFGTRVFDIVFINNRDFMNKELVVDVKERV